MRSLILRMLQHVLPTQYMHIPMPKTTMERLLLEVFILQMQNGKMIMLVHVLNCTGLQEQQVTKQKPFHIQEI